MTLPDDDLLLRLFEQIHAPTADDDMNGQRLDLTTPGPVPPGVVSGSAKSGARYLGVHFACCDAYARIYPNRDSTAYVGHCPRCAKRIQIPIGPGGTDARFFVAQ